jgi:diguanylate cyclase (GGDEF)-like protein/PAS domain S-box-containing protein
VIATRAARGPLTRLSDFWWLIYLAVAGVAGVGYLTLKGTFLHSGPVFNCFGLSAVLAIVGGIRMHRIAKLAWALIGAGMLSFVVGDVLAYNYKRFFGTELPFPSIADAFYLATYPLLIAGLVLLVRKRSRAHDRGAMIDALIVSTSAGALSWALLIAPYAHDSSLSVGTKLTSVAYPIMDLAVAACVARLAFGVGRRPTSFLLLTLGVLCLLLTDAIYGWALLHGGYDTGGLLDGGWIAFYVLLGAAALHRTAPALVDPVPDTQFRLTTPRLAGLALSAVVAPAVLAVQGLEQGVRDVPLLATCSALVFLMVVLRMFDLGKRHEAALARATALASAGAGLVEAHTVADVAHVASSAGQTMLGPASTVVLVSDPAAADLRSDETQISLPLQGRGSTHGALLAHTQRGRDADTVEGLRALAHEVALALDGIELAKSLLMQRTEARFQSLVQHSSDAILVVDAEARIEFASPSTKHVLDAEPGELIGKSFLELVSDVDRARIGAALLASTGPDSGQSVEFELSPSKGSLEVEAVYTNLLGDENVGGIVVNLRDISERKNFERQLAHQAFHDEVTGLANRALFRDRVTHALERVRRGATVAILFIDLDDFKTVNDTLGHEAGDRLIQIVAHRIATAARSVDTSARLGGDEFAVLVDDAGLDDAMEVAERLLGMIAVPVDLDGKELLVTASIGIACAEKGSAVSVDTLLRDADVAMYSAKASGKGTCQAFADEMHEAVLERLELKRELQLALERGEFQLFYQPIVDLASGDFVSLEALLRWRHPERGFIPPSQFIELAEETGAIVPIGRWVLQQACEEAARLVSLFGDFAPGMCVNLSARQLQRSELVPDVLDSLQQSGLPAERLVLEITETAMMVDVEPALAKLHALREHGVRLAVDDFGSGYSSLNYVRSFPINLLKIDRAFTADIDKPGDVASLARTIVDLTEILGITAVAEGIENPAQLERLRGIGCTLGQGFLFMPPSPAHDVEAELTRRIAARGRARLTA